MMSPPELWLLLVAHVHNRKFDGPSTENFAVRPLILDKPFSILKLAAHAG